MGTVCRDLTGKNEVLFIYTQRYVPGRAFEAIGSLGGLTLASRVSACGYEGYSFAGITPKVIRLIREHREKLYAVCFYCDFDNRGAIRAILAHFKNESFYKLVGGPHTMHVGPEDFDWFGADAILCGDGEASSNGWTAIGERQGSCRVLFRRRRHRIKRGSMSCFPPFPPIPSLTTDE